LLAAIRHNLLFGTIRNLLKDASKWQAQSVCKALCKIGNDCGMAARGYTGNPSYRMWRRPIMDEIYTRLHKYLVKSAILIFASTHQ
jgi:hypothetical protein